MKLIMTPFVSEWLAFLFLVSNLLFRFLIIDISISNQSAILNSKMRIDIDSWRSWLKLSVTAVEHSTLWSFPILRRKTFNTLTMLEIKPLLTYLTRDKLSKTYRIGSSFNKLLVIFVFYFYVENQTTYY